MPSRLRRLALLTGATLLAATGCTSGAQVDEPRGSGQEAPRLAPSRAADPDAPNVVLITSDDQTEVELRWMPKTRRLIGRAGVRFDDMVAPHPNCCPARAQILSGQYAHNNGVRTNSPPWGGHQGFDPENALPVWLQRAGYATGFVGKYMHGYDDRDGIEPGWDRWRPIIGVLSNYRNFLQYDDGELVRFGPEDYYTDTVAQQSREMVRQFSRAKKPFFLWSSFIAPHGTCEGYTKKDCSGPPPAADRHADILGDVPLPSLESPAFNEDDVSDKPRASRRGTKVDPAAQQELFTQRIRALAALDDAVAGIVAELKERDQLDDTVLMFTSDNGYLFGEHRLVGKNVPYEPAVKVPLVMRGPGIPAGERRAQTVAMIDLAPTIAELAGATAAREMDGVSILPYARADEPQGDRALLLQAGSPGKVKARAWKWRSVRTDRYTLTRWKVPRFWELYDREADPAQLDNVYDDDRYAGVREALEPFLLKSLADCRGEACRAAVPDLPEPAPTAADADQ
ncbi:sulfatase family protein [Nocardioides campestrisoli]|uniref:sulfatase family protein n=1 Tax=Nocardioides campestrisoli TaxID=2736757 RepID=UPI0015E644CD|nr:sulfatase [Nocardioides campestrisoli]